MKTIFVFSLVFCLLVSQTIAAWTWDTYQGITQWRVDVTEDETGCGADAPTTDSIAVSIQHNLEIADLGNMGHGNSRGAFIGNTLSIPSRTIPDGKGSSKLYAVDLAFTPDCLSFSGKYPWDYEDSEYQCSGSTTLRGKRLDGKDCPGVPQGAKEEELKQKLVDIRAASDNTIKENSYKEILTKDPKNFWANWDMAELKKKQGSYDEYLKYVDMATTNENIDPETRQELKKGAANRLHISDFPTATSSPILRVEMDELNNWNGGFIYNVNVPKEAANKETWKMKIWTVFNRYSQNLLNDAVGLPKE